MHNNGSVPTVFPSRTISRRLQTWVVICAALGIFGIGFVLTATGLYPTYTHLIDQEEKILALMLHAKSLALEEYFGRMRDAGERITGITADCISDQEVLAQACLVDGFDRAHRTAFARTVGDSPRAVGVARFNLAGKKIAEVGTSVPLAWKPRKPKALQSVRLTGPVISEGNPYAVVTAPVVGANEQVVGYDLLLFRLYDLTVVASRSPISLPHGEIILTSERRDKVELVFPFNAQGRRYSEVSRTSVLGRAAYLAARNETGFLHYASDNHKDMVAYTPIRHTNWGLLIAINRDDLYGSVYAHVKEIAYLTLLMLVGGTLGMIMLVRPLTGKMIIRADELEAQVLQKTADLQKELESRKRMGQWLIDSERRYRTLLEEVPDVIFVLDERGRLYYVNTQAEALLDARVNVVLETPLEDFVADADKDLFRTLFQTPLDAIWDQEVRITTAVGTPKDTRIRCKASLVDNPPQLRYEGVMRDITHRRFLEQEIKASREQLLEKIKIIDDLYAHLVETGKAKAIADHTAEVAHELRQPLAIIGGFARRMARRFEQPALADHPDLKDSCSMIISEVRRLESILTNLIEFTRHEGVHLIGADPNELISRVIHVHEPRLQEKNLTVETNLGSELGEIPLDSARFEQVVRNLLSNAIEASPAAGVIHVETSGFVPSDKALASGGLESQGLFEMKIRNEGSGIPPEDLKEIFSPFYTTKEYGTGVGLTICKRIVEDHHGSISAKSDESGTTFTVWLPLISCSSQICEWPPNRN